MIHQLYTFVQLETNLNDRIIDFLKFIDTWSPMGGALVGRDGGSLGLDHLLDLPLHCHERVTEEGRLRVLRGAPEPGYVRFPGLVPVALLLQDHLVHLPRTGVDEQRLQLRRVDLDFGV